MTSIVVPQLSLSMEEAKVSRWLVADRDAVVAGQPVVEVETDKATVEIESPCAGVLRIVAAEGAVVAVEGVLAEVVTIDASDNGQAQHKGVELPPARVSTDDGAAAAAAPAGAPHRRSRPIASPAARRLAREQGVELSALQGSGPGGRIVARDVGPRPVNGGSATAPDERLRAAVVANITASWQQIPHVHIGGELAADGVVGARTSTSDATVTDLLVVALARALAEVPELNALLRPDGSVERRPTVHLALAVATAGGVVAPVLRDAGTLTPAEVARERRRLVDAARQGALGPADLAGATCTLSNLGAHPVDFFAPVVSGPQVAMVATGRIADRPVVVDGMLGIRPRMWANVAIDHRAADGEAGGRLLAAFERQMALLPGGPT